MRPNFSSPWYLSFLRGIVTTMTNPSPGGDDTIDFQGIVEATAPLMELADRMGWPKTWLTCDHCGEYAWRVPPHIFEPCPLVVETMQTAGLKMDAERNQAIATGVAMRQQMEAFQAFVDEHMRGEDDDE